MQNPQITQLVLVAAAMLILAIVLIGSGIAMYRNKQKTRIAAEKRALQTADPQESAAPAPAASPVGPAVDEAEILRILRNPLDGRLTVRILGGPPVPPASLPPEQADVVRRILAELSPGAGSAPPEETTPQAPPAAEPLAPVIPFAESLPRRVELEDVLPFRRKNIPKLDKAPPPPKSITSQIDEIVQRRLAESPAAGQAVRLSEDLHGGLRIIVGQQTFDGIDQVDDPQIRALIMASVQEWNEQNRIKPSSPGTAGEG